jgi:hypothetical protein
MKAIKPNWYCCSANENLHGAEEIAEKIAQTCPFETGRQRWHPARADA